MSVGPESTNSVEIKSNQVSVMFNGQRQMIVSNNGDVYITGQFTGNGAGLTNVSLVLGKISTGSNGAAASWMVGLDSTGKTTTNAVPSGGGTIPNGLVTNSSTAGLTVTNSSAVGGVPLTNGYVGDPNGQYFFDTSQATPPSGISMQMQKFIYHSDQGYLLYNNAGGGGNEAIRFENPGGNNYNDSTYMTFYQRLWFSPYTTTEACRIWALNDDPNSWTNAATENTSLIFWTIGGGNERETMRITPQGVCKTLNGFASNSNSIPVSVSVGASPFLFTNTTANNIFCDIDASSSITFALAKNGVTIVSSQTGIAGEWSLKIGDVFGVTYSGGTPSILTNRW
jgi:hypothetical protein